MSQVAPQHYYSLSHGVVLIDRLYYARYRTLVSSYLNITLKILSTH